MQLKELVKSWFDNWEQGNFEHIPIEENFKHTSPYGVIDGKKAYLDMVRANKEAFLGGHFEVHDEIYDQNKACVRYTMQKGDFSMDVTEWFFIGEQRILEIISYYNVGRSVSYEKDLNRPK